MKHFARLSLAFAVILTTCLAPAAELLLGGRTLTPAKVSKAVKGIGRFVARDGSGMYRLALSKGIQIALAKKRLKARGVEHVFDSSAADVDNHKLASVRNHIKYLEVAFETRTGRDAEEAEKAGEETGTDFYEALEHWLKIRVDQFGNFDPDWLLRAAKQRDALPGATLGGGEVGAQATFEYLGPKNLDIPYTTYYGKRPLSGRKSNVAYAPSNAQIIYAASSGGGLWKSTDGGTTWSVKSDSWIGTNAESVAIDPTNPNIVYVGTGDYEGFPIQTYGIMKSTDGGNTWNNYGAADFGTNVVSNIIVMPDNPNIIVVTTGRGSASGAGRIWRSTNSGVTWDMTNSPTGNWDDIDISKIKSGGGYDLYAVGTKANTNGGLVYKSTDSGGNWVTCGAHQNSAIPSAIDIACSPNNSNVVYLLDTAIAPGGIYKSTNGGSNWSPITNGFPNGNNNYNWSQRSYDYHITCGNNNGQDAVFVGLITVAYSPNGGNSWIDIGNTYGEAGGPINTHNDQHCFAVNPQANNEFIIGNDGGLHKLVMSNMANGSGTWTGLNAQIFDTMIYEMDVHPSNANYILTGTQDNASPVARGDLANWDNLYAGDGAWPAFDRLNDGVHYTQSYNLSVYKYNTFTDFSPTSFDPPISGGFIAPLIVAGNGQELFAAGNQLCYHPGHPSGAGSWIVRPTVISSSSVDELASAPSSGGTIYTGDAGGQLWRTPDKGVTLTRIDGNLANRAIGAIAVDWTNPNDILVGFSDYAGSSHILRCTDTTAASPAFTDVTGNLPNAGVQAIARDPNVSNTWYAGTDVGAFMTTDGGASWTNMHALGLPNVQVTACHINGAKTHLYVGTYGRGVWRIGIGGAPDGIIKGKVVEGGVGQSGVSVLLSRYQDISPSITSSPNLSIPDNNTTGVTANLYVPVSATIKNVACHVKITHTAIGDLQVTLRAPDGSQTILHNQTGGTGDNIDQTYQVTAFNGKNSTGTWKLIVKDLAASNTGTLNQFDLTVTYAGYANLATQTTDSAGAYQFTGLDDGDFRIYPTKSGKMFGPKWRLITLPPDPPSQDFASGPIRTFTTATITPNTIYGLTNTFATINLSGPAPFPMQVFISKSNTTYMYAPAGIVIPTGNTSATFVLGAGNVTTDLVGTVTWTYYEMTKTATFTVKPKPVITAFTMTPSSVKGGNPTTGTITISKPALTGTIDMYAFVSDNSTFAATPTTTSWQNGATQSSFTVTTSTVTTSTLVTMSANFYNSTRTTTFTITP